MSYSRRSRYSPSLSPPHQRYGRSLSRSRSRSSSRSRSYDPSDIENPGNNLYVTGLSPRITKRDLEKHFSTEGKVEDVHLVIDPRTRESRGFGFVSMSNIKEADRCIKYLDGSVLEGRVITVEKSVVSVAAVALLLHQSSTLTNKQISDYQQQPQRAKRRRGRTPTPGRYLGLRSSGRGRSPTYSPYSRSRSRSRSYSPYYHSRGGRSYSSYRRRRSYSPYSRSPVGRRRSYTPDYYYYRRSNSRYSREDSYSRKRGGDYYYRRGRSRRRSVSVSSSGRSYESCSSRSVSPRPRRRRSYYSSSPSSRSRSSTPYSGSSRGTSLSSRSS